eukprot:4558903-Amphidinium_carterae.1
MELEGTLITMTPTFYMLITMSSGYAGRDNLAALFRPVAIMVSGYALIGHTMSYVDEYSFADAQVLLSVIAHQLLDLFGNKADMKSYNVTATLEFGGTLITMKLRFNVFLTTNP